MMTRKQPMPFLAFAILTLVSCSFLAGNPLQAQDTDRGRRVFDDAPQEPRQRGADDQRDTAQEPRRRAPAAGSQEDARQREDRQLDRPSTKLVPPGTGWDGGRWVLGITSQTTSSGVRVDTVMPGSAASRAGLEPGDLIVTVDGFQVGRVGSRHYPLGEELQIRAGQRGDVLLLVQNRRNDQLVNLPVQLRRRPRIDNWPPRRRHDDGGFFRPFQQRQDGDRRSTNGAPVE